MSVNSERRSRRGNPLLERPVCPVHGLAMLVGRTVDDLQYRYCRVDGCGASCTTLRRSAPHYAVGAQFPSDRIFSESPAPADGFR